MSALAHRRHGQRGNFDPAQTDEPELLRSRAFHIAQAVRVDNSTGLNLIRFTRSSGRRRMSQVGMIAQPGREHAAHAAFFEDRLYFARYRRILLGLSVAQVDDKAAFEVSLNMISILDEAGDAFAMDKARKRHTGSCAKRAEWHRLAQHPEAERPHGDHALVVRFAAEEVFSSDDEVARLDALFQSRVDFVEQVGNELSWFLYAGRHEIESDHTAVMRDIVAEYMCNAARLPAIFDCHGVLLICLPDADRQSGQRWLKRLP